MPEFQCEVMNRKGMHARAAAKIVNLVEQYNCDVLFQLSNRTAPADNLIKLLTLNAPQGSKITVKTSGPDAEKISPALQTLFEQGFGD